MQYFFDVWVVKYFIKLAKSVSAGQKINHSKCFGFILLPMAKSVGAGLPIFDFLVALLIFYEILDFLVALSIFNLLMFSLKVFHQDSLGRNELVGYGFSHIPTSAGL